jgi:transcriptional regulator with XRE-family HTH domain
MQDSIGSRLRFAREAKGVSVSELSAKVRVREVLIKHIEKDEFEKVGADVYVRGHIRAMAQSLDLNPDELMALYPASGVGDSPFDQPVLAPETEILEVASVVAVQQNNSSQFSGSFFKPLENIRARSGTNWSLLMASTLGVITLIAIGSVVVSTFNSPTNVVAEETVSPTPTPTPAATKEVEDLTANVPAPGVDVLLKAEGNSSWVRATDVNDVELFEGIIREGQEQRVGSVEGVKLLMGNAGAITLTVNGQVLGKAGGNGEVVRVEFGPEGPVQ